MGRVCTSYLRRDLWRSVPASFECGCALPDVAGFAQYLEGGPLREEPLRTEAKMARCLAFMPDFWWRACLVVVSCDMAGKPFGLAGPLLTSERCFWGLGRSPA